MKALIKNFTHQCHLSENSKKNFFSPFSGHCGCAKGQFETVKILNSRGANLWLRNARGDLPVHEAAASGRIELVEWLLQQKPNHINSSSNDGRTILHIAAGGDKIDMCKMLIEMGADVNAVYRNNKNVVKTPLDCALQKGFRTTAKYIQTHGGGNLRDILKGPWGTLKNFLIFILPLILPTQVFQQINCVYREERRIQYCQNSTKLSL